MRPAPALRVVSKRLQFYWKANVNAARLPQVLLCDGRSQAGRQRQLTRFKDRAYSGCYRSDGQLLVAGGESGVVQVSLHNGQFPASSNGSHGAVTRLWINPARSHALWRQSGCSLSRCDGAQAAVHNLGAGFPDQQPRSAASAEGAPAAGACRPLLAGQAPRAVGLGRRHGADPYHCITRELQ